jgi:preprotein translocase subunit SecA
MRRYRRRVAEIGAMEARLADLPDDELESRARGLRARAELASLDDLLVEVFAVAREASRRVLGMRHYDVQLIGAMALHDGHIAEMKTGEGKTLAATAAVILNALPGAGVHVVTVNDYLADRDARWMEPLYRFFGLTVGTILEELGEREDDEIVRRRQAYGADITYGTNHEIAFDYLRDNLAASPGQIVQRGFNFALVDEVDFLLIDEARTPLIISGPADQDQQVWKTVDRVVSRLRESIDTIVEPMSRSAALTDAGFAKVERALGVANLSDLANLALHHAVHQSVIAHGMFKRDVDYVVEDGRLLLVDPFTGRISEDKRMSDGLHQALEAKEGVAIESEDLTVAKVTYQTFFARYKKLAGMTGTAKSRRKEFRETYGREVQVIPTHAPMIRVDFADAIFDTIADKHAAVVADILRRHKVGQPVLVGTTSVRESEQLSQRLRRAGVPHELLNAKNHAAEARIVAQAGRKGVVTISTNMAGRGTDIVLGGSAEAVAGLDGPGAERAGSDRAREHKRPPAIKLEDLRSRCAAEREQVVAVGGLHVIGTAHHDSVRLDDQLRGRAGRQGDPGSSHFVVSLDDEITKRFGAETIAAIREALAERGHPPGHQITWAPVARALRELQTKVAVEDEAERAEILKFDIVVHAQREATYAWRRSLVLDEGFDGQGLVADLVGDLITVAEDRASLATALHAHFHAPFELGTGDRLSEKAEAPLRRALEVLAEHERRYGSAQMLETGRRVLLDTLDSVWTDHLSALERLEDAVGMHGYAGIDPVVAWRKEATVLWQDAVRRIRSRAVSQWFMVARRGQRS